MESESFPSSSSPLHESGNGQRYKYRYKYKYRKRIPQKSSVKNTVKKQSLRFFQKYKPWIFGLLGLLVLVAALLYAFSEAEEKVLMDLQGDKLSR